MSKLCINCRHARRAEHHPRPSTCTAVMTETQNLVTGRMEEDDVFTCEFMRTDFFLARVLGAGKCGPEGKLWEPKNEEAA